MLFEPQGNVALVAARGPVQATKVRQVQGPLIQENGVVPVPQSAGQGCYLRRLPRGKGPTDALAAFVGAQTSAQVFVPAELIAIHLPGGVGESRLQGVVGDLLEQV